MAKAKKSKTIETRENTGMPKIEYMRLDSIPPWPRNPKKHDIPTLKDSLRRWGFVQLAIFDETTGRLIAGHGRIEAVTEMRTAGEQPPARVLVDPDGVWKIPVLRGLSFASEQEAEAYLVADNRTNELGGWDDGMLQQILAELQASGNDADLAGLGWSDKEINALTRATNFDRDLGPSPEEKLESYTNAAIKQMVLFFDAEEYDKTMARMQRVMDHAKRESHTEAFLALLDEYEEKHADTLPELDPQRAEEEAA